MINQEINLPQSFSRNTVKLCTSRNIYSLDTLIRMLKLGKRIKHMTGQSQRSFNEIINALPSKIKSDYLNRSIDITKHYFIDYSLSRGDQELFFQYYLDDQQRNFCLQNGFETYKKFIHFLKKEIRLNNLPGANNYTESKMFSLMPEHIRGWYKRFHILGLKRSFSTLSPESDHIDKSLLYQLSERAQNLAINYGLYNRIHFEEVYANEIVLENFQGIGKGVALEFRKIYVQNSLIF